MITTNNSAEDDQWQSWKRLGKNMGHFIILIPMNEKQQEDLNIYP